jgi:hypothetical protein
LDPVRPILTYSAVALPPEKFVSWLKYAAPYAVSAATLLTIVISCVVAAAVRLVYGTVNAVQVGPPPPPAILYAVPVQVTPDPVMRVVEPTPRKFVPPLVSHVALLAVQVAICTLPSGNAVTPLTTVQAPEQDIVRLFFPTVNVPPEST